MVLVGGRAWWLARDRGRYANWPSTTAMFCACWALESLTSWRHVVGVVSDEAVPPAHRHRPSGHVHAMAGCDHRRPQIVWVMHVTILSATRPYALRAAQTVRYTGQARPRTSQRYCRIRQLVMISSLLRASPGRSLSTTECVTTSDACPQCLLHRSTPPPLLPRRPPGSQPLPHRSSLLPRDNRSHLTVACRSPSALSTSHDGL